MYQYITWIYRFKSRKDKVKRVNKVIHLLLLLRFKVPILTFSHFHASLRHDNNIFTSGWIYISGCPQDLDELNVLDKLKLGSPAYPNSTKNLVTSRSVPEWEQSHDTWWKWLTPLLRRLGARVGTLFCFSILTSFLFIKKKQRAFTYRALYTPTVVRNFSWMFALKNIWTKE